MYDKSGGGVKLRKFMGVSLAWWHNYKWASNKIWSVFSVEFIAPLFHHLFPSKQFRVDKASHSQITTILSYIRLSYPSFKDKLDALMETSDMMTVRQRSLLQNLQDLCEYFIPVVYFLFVCCFLCIHCMYGKNISKKFLGRFLKIYFFISFFFFCLSFVSYIFRFLSC